MKISRSVLIHGLLAAALAGFAVLPANADTTIYVPVPPPAPKIIIKPVPPSTLHVWIPGRWAWVSGRWVWHNGHWAKPRHRGERWVAGHWKKHRRGWLWVPGHWKRHR